VPNTDRRNNLTRSRIDLFALVSMCGTLRDPFSLGQHPGGILDPNNWSGRRRGYHINNQLNATDGGPIYWRPTAFDPDQEAAITLARIDPDGRRHGLLLKVGNGGCRNGAIGVFYNARAKVITIETFVPGQTWLTKNSIFRTLANGDELGAIAFAGGHVEAYVNNTLVVEANAGEFFAGTGGRIGLWFTGSRSEADDFCAISLIP